MFIEDSSYPWFERFGLNMFELAYKFQCHDGNILRVFLITERSNN